MMQLDLTQLQEGQPLSAAELATRFPYCGALQVLAGQPNGQEGTARSLYFPLPLSGFSDPTSENAPAANATITPPAESTKPPGATEPPIFEPYHTVDYFASVGVRPPSLEHAQDRFGQQLRSFTDWLKVMKRVPLTEITRQIPVEREKEVAELAHHSLDEKQVWTEAMAEVWAKQGERQKAIRIYEKLSLLEPAKSAYFAGKIEVLKLES